MPIDSTILEDAKTRTEFDTVCKSMGMDPSTAINMFVSAIISSKEFHFTPQPAESPKMTMKEAYGCMKGEIWMSDDFNAPMEDFKEYME